MHFLLRINVPGICSVPEQTTFFSLWKRRKHENGRIDGGGGSRAEQVHEFDDGATDFVRAVNVSKGLTIATKVIWAGTSAARRKGLLGRDSISRDEGMYIVPTQWIHMFGMRFPIDVAFLSEDGKVLHIHRELKPNRLSRPVWRAEGALELAAGVLRESNTEVGDRIEFE
jgi:uncharacterized membrane protein (UPF0127 family)